MRFASRKTAVLGLFMTATVTLFYGLRPFNFFSDNHVHWLQDQTGAQFHKEGGLLPLSSPGVIYSPSPMHIQSVGSEYCPATIELYIEPHDEAYDYVAHILAFGDAARIEPFIIGQWRSDLEIICQSAGGRSSENYRNITLKGVLHKDVKTMVTIVSGRDEICVYLNGQLAKKIATKALIGLEQFRGHLMLGNASDCGNQWKGKLFGLALYSGTLSPDQVHRNCQSWIDSDTTASRLAGSPIALYTFAEQEGSHVFNQVEDRNHLIIPESYSPLKRNMLRPFWRGVHVDRWLLQDVIINVFGFMPIAFCMAACLNRRLQDPSMNIVLAVVVVGAIVSLGIEISQAYLPTRTSSLLDVVCNAFGASLGALSYRTLFQKAFSLRCTGIGHGPNEHRN